MSKDRTFFEQVPLEIVRRICQEKNSQRATRRSPKNEEVDNALHRRENDKVKRSAES
jgi:hypothetical protein